MTDEKIEPTLADAAQMAGYVELHEVLLVELKSRIHESRDNMIESLPWQLNFKEYTSFGYDDESNILSVTVGFGVRTIDGNLDDDDFKVGLACECEFLLEYSYRAHGGPEGDELNRYFGAFAKYNAVYNAWPYFRECVHSTVARMGLPPLIIPVYRIPRAEPCSEPEPGTKEDDSRE